MANYCENDLTIRGPKKQLETFLNKLIDEEGDIQFNNIIPMPKKHTETGKWYEWCLKNWGCKWSPYKESQSIDRDGIEEYAHLYFDTPWSPPLQFLKNASKKYKKLVFILKYEEEGNGFAGISRACNGELIDNCINIY